MTLLSVQLCVGRSATYLAPEYLSTEKLTEKTDVFAYGIMLLELVTGQRAFDHARLAYDADFMLLDWVKRFLREKKFQEVVDLDLIKNSLEAVVEPFIQVALICTQTSPLGRPKMSEVVRLLEGDGLAERWEEWQNVEVVQNQTIDGLAYRSQTGTSSTQLVTVLPWNCQAQGENIVMVLP